MIKKIIHKKNTIAIIFKNHKFSDGLNFYSHDKDFLQIGTWAYNKKKTLQRHFHKIHKKNSNLTQEFIYVVNGKLKISFYTTPISDLSVKLIDKIILKKNDFALIYRLGHEYQILEDNTNIIEIKNGPYLGPQIDRERY